MVAPDWLDAFPDESTKQYLFFRWFNEAPAPSLLRCLSWHLSSVEPLAGHSVRNSLVLPLSANIAADMLTSRFIEDQRHLDTSYNAIKEVLEEGLKTPAAAEELAGLLATIPDKVALVPLESCPKLQADLFIPFLVENLIACVEQGGSKYTNIVAEVVSRVIQRGHTRLVASTMASQMLVSSASSTNTTNAKVLSSILAEFPASSALEKLVEALLTAIPPLHQQQQQQQLTASMSTSEQNAAVCIDALQTLLTVELWQQHSEIRLLLQDKMLTQKVLSSPSLMLLLTYLDKLSSLNTSSTSSKDTTTTNNDILAAATWRVACQWGEKSSIQRLPTAQQAYMTCTLVQSLHLLGKSRFEGYSGLLPALLRGISARLNSPREPIRRQAMRVGNTMSQILDNDAPPLFGDGDIELLHEEQWEDTEETSSKKEKQNTTSSTTTKKKKVVKSKITEATSTSTNDDDYPMTETDSDDENVSSASSTDSEFEKYDLGESDDDDVEKTNLQLRDIISLIQKSESDWKGHLRALRSVEALIRAAPDELAHYSVPLARTLLLTTAPSWADEELPRGEDPIDDQRFRSLVALTAAVPESVGLSLAAEVYSPSLDVQQRSRALAVMAAAAQELSFPGSILKSLEGTDGASSGGEISSSKSTQRYLQGEKVPGKAGRVTRASERSLAASSAAATSGNKINRFPPIALKWAVALLKECDVRRHGVDLFGRDYFILGRLLATLGTFLESSQQSPEAAPLAAAVIELIKGQNVHDNEEPYVRRAALMAAAHACMAIPPGSIATALLPAAAFSSTTSTKTIATSSSTALVERLEWLRGWAEEVSESDPDNNCRMMAAACRGLQGTLSAEAMASLAVSVSEQQQQSLGSGGNVILPSFSGSGVGSMPSVNVRIPRIETLTLK